MYRLGASSLIALVFCAAVARADDEALPPPPPPTAPDSIIPTTPISPLEPPMEAPPQSPDRLPPSGSLPPMGTLAPEDIPNPPVLSPTSPEVPDTTEPGTPAPESPTKKAEVDEVPAPPPPVAAETEVKPSKDLDQMLAPTETAKDENDEIPPPAPFEETPEVAETKDEPRPDEPRPQADAEPETRTARMSVSERARLRHIPQYQKIKPQWAFQFTYSPNALGNGDIADANEGAKATGEQLSIEFQPRFLQSAGVIGFGPTLSIYPISKTFNVTSGDFAIWAVGAQVRYQARFFREQPLVPVAGFAWERLTYHLTNLGPAGATRDANSAIDVTGPFFGVWFLLNILEPSQASVGYLNSGLVRSYLVAELRSMTGSDDDVDVSGNSYFFGLRIEF